MFIGHYAVGFVLKKKTNNIPLWLLFVSVQLVDIMAFLFVLLGIEKISYNPSKNPFLRTIIEYVPYSHSLFANALLSLVVFLIFWKLKSKEWGIVLNGTSLSISSNIFATVRDYFYFMSWCGHKLIIFLPSLKTSWFASPWTLYDRCTGHRFI